MGHTSDTISLSFIINKESNPGGVFFKTEFPMHRNFIFVYISLRKVDKKYLDSSKVWC